MKHGAVKHEWHQKGIKSTHNKSYPSFYTEEMWECTGILLLYIGKNSQCKLWVGIEDIINKSGAYVTDQYKWDKP